MSENKPKHIETIYYSGPERRHAALPRRKSDQDRRHRFRYESLVSDCRLHEARRKEDEEGFIEFSSLYADTKDQPQNKK